MLVTCESCGVSYNDEYRWTVCPHMPLESTPEPFDPVANPHGYCREHDLFGPHVGHEPKRVDSVGIWRIPSHLDIFWLGFVAGMVATAVFLLVAVFFV
jgi:hypothetical protein